MYKKKKKKSLIHVEELKVQEYECIFMISEKIEQVSQFKYT